MDKLSEKEFVTIVSVQSGTRIEGDFPKEMIQPVLNAVQEVHRTPEQRRSLCSFREFQTCTLFAAQNPCFHFGTDVVPGR